MCIRDRYYSLALNNTVTITLNRIVITLIQKLSLVNFCAIGVLSNWTSLWLFWGHRPPSAYMEESLVEKTHQCKLVVEKVEDQEKENGMCVWLDYL